MKPSGEHALLRTFDGDAVEANRRVLAAYEGLRARRPSEVEDVIPGARTLLVTLRPGDEPSDELLRALERDPEVEPIQGREHEIPVVYDGEDLGDVASRHGMSLDDLVRTHTQAEYTVAFIGFSPGFPYLLGLPERLHTPRRATPRTRVPAGSVAIGAEWAGIYPASTPGGWNLIGRTSVELLDPTRDPPTTLAPGDRVRFFSA